MDPNHAKMTQFMKKLKERMKDTKKRYPYKKEMIWIYFTGHGVYSSTENMVLNDQDRNKRYFNLEW